MRAIVICLIAAVIIFAAFTNLYVYARSAYTNGLLDGYKAGEAQGKQEAMVALQQWQYNHKCKETLDGFVSFKTWRDERGAYQFDCIIK